ncbi:CLUMA_CG002655, isoform A [Clunio marinus]|uniref:CLUMA_CG002655, isoform A n=1 Tax=Clunio marinus TaxID=568069 RepID=A0A1J1HS01_9DIPT|nr:CLUMA_CG002655, isoform A [Clunio marinus]
MALKSGTSDFSIDHILNRAGDQYSKNKQCEIFETISMTSSPSSSCDESVNCDNYEKKICHNGCGDSERFMEIPTFDWLNYTRYNMPRMPRPTKGPARRTPGRLPRIPFTPYQLNELENAYKTATYLSTEDANKLAKRLDLTGVRVKIWFQNRRARDRRERKDLSLNKSLKKPSDEEEEIIVN